MNTHAQGVLVRWMPERHFGFINIGDDEIFAHELNFEYGPIRKGDRVDLELGTFKGRATAKNVKLIGHIDLPDVKGAPTRIKGLGLDGKPNDITPYIPDAEGGR